MAETDERVAQTVILHHRDAHLVGTVLPLLRDLELVLFLSPTEEVLFQPNRSKTLLAYLEATIGNGVLTDFSRDVLFTQPLLFPDCLL